MGATAQRFQFVEKIIHVHILKNAIKIVVSATEKLFATINKT